MQLCFFADYKKSWPTFVVTQTHYIFIREVVLVRYWKQYKRLSLVLTWSGQGQHWFTLDPLLGTSAGKLESTGPAHCKLVWIRHTGQTTGIRPTCFRRNWLTCSSQEALDYWVACRAQCGQLSMDTSFTTKESLQVAGRTQAYLNKRRLDCSSDCT